MRRLAPALMLAFVLALAGCGDDEGTAPAGGSEACNSPETLTNDEAIWCAYQIGETW
ncbi:hypothetical protein [Herbidospora daliensis]|uniref:hypothetical protein n=1 Tax=Herbidospora daliensis TaxID=295585 RepID=UPI000ADF1A9D|nr:hypothetical protein [Herbidospora daliensis]